MVPALTERSTLSSALKSPNERVTPRTRIARSESSGIGAGPAFRLLRHVDECRHSGAELRLPFAQADPRGKDLIRTLVGCLKVARRVLALRVNVPDLRLGHVGADVELVVLE